ncbi:MAG TPA: LPS export ABC transporter periplasmic protein LptC [Gammaproteobacteria bacterium]|nr:LPS export ABC transporter periplasmic protein LptC [Gammaproteobacteria bacterium]
MAGSGTSRPAGGRPFWLAVLVAIAAGMTVILMWQRQGPAPEPAAEGPEVDAEAWQVHLRQRDADGQAWELFADHAAHYPEAGHTKLTEVRLVLRRADRPSITAEARRGRVNDADNRVTLEGDVTLVDPEGYRMTTPTLHYLPDAERAETDAPVRLVADFGEATAVGATIWTGQRRLRLHDQVHTTAWRDPRDAS